MLENESVIRAQCASSASSLMCVTGTLWMALQQGAYHGAGRQPRLRAMLRTAVEVAEGMAYIHSRRIVHGDLSSRNVLLMHAHAEADATAKVTAGSKFPAGFLHSWFRV